MTQAVRERHWARLAVGGLVAALAAGWSVRHEISRPSSIRIADYGVANMIAEELAREAQSESASAARAVVERQLETEPAELTTIDPSAGPLRVPVELAGIAGTFIELHAMAAEFADREDDTSRAEFHRKRADVLRTLNSPYRRAAKD
jgi:hypothetical protein